MFQNYLKITFRKLLNNKLFSLINIFGLSVGLAAVMLIFMFIRHELSYDRFHPEGDNIYRISVLTERGDIAEDDSYIFTPPIGPDMKHALPEVADYMRFSTNRTMNSSYDEKAFNIESIRYADSTLFNFFSFPLLKGDRNTALTAPYSVVLGERLAAKIFGNKNPLNEVIKLDDGQQYEVTGVIQDPPANSHIEFDALISFQTLFSQKDLHLGWDGGNQYITYLKLNDQADATALEAKFPSFMWEKINRSYSEYGLELKAYLQPLEDIHLFFNPYSANLRTNLAIFAAIGFLILFIACVNFINLTTAQASSRVKEIGLRKVLGAQRKDLISQFLGESFLTTFISFAAALCLVTQFVPIYGALVGKDLMIGSSIDAVSIGGLVLLLLIVGLTVGSYPALYLSSLKIVETIKGIISKNKQSKSHFRNTLVVFQFAISAMLIVSTIIISRQLSYLQTKELGFDKDQVLVLPLTGEEAQLNTPKLKQELLGLAQVKQATASSEIPGEGFTSNGYIPEGLEQPIMANVVDVDEDFLKTYELELTEGRFFATNRPSDQTGYLINESFARLMNWEEPIGKLIQRNGDHRVIGVVKDFHFAPLHSKIQPLIITHQPWQERFSFLTIKLKPGQLDESIASIQQTWNSVIPETPMNFWFLDESIGAIYDKEVRFRKMFLYFSTLSIIIALLGMWGLATLLIRYRTKEVGVRKVLGATERQLIGLLSGDFIILVVIALALAFPISWLGMNRWLENFAYRIDISWWTFVISGKVVLMVAFLTIAARALHTARINPVEALRNE